MNVWEIVNCFALKSTHINYFVNFDDNGILIKVLVIRFLGNKYWWIVPLKSSDNAINTALKKCCHINTDTERITMAFFNYFKFVSVLLQSAGIDDVIMCIAHRGRLNLLTCLLKFPPVAMFQKVMLHSMNYYAWFLSAVELVMIEWCKTVYLK